MPKAPVISEETFLNKARDVYRSVFDADQQDQLITLTQRENRILEKTAELERWLLEQHLAADSARTFDAINVRVTCCPKCHKPGVPEKEDLVPRRIKTRAGKHQFERCKYKCQACRLVFFPLGRQIKSGAGEL